jgi:hypothetical protein
LTTNINFKNNKNIKSNPFDSYSNNYTTAHQYNNQPVFLLDAIVLHIIAPVKQANVFELFEN